MKQSTVFRRESRAQARARPGGASSRTQLHAGSCRSVASSDTPLRFTVAVVLAIVGCNPAATRPFFGPLSGALTDTVTVEPEIAMEAARVEITALNMVIRKFSAAQGYLETAWFDLRDGTSSGSANAVDSVFQIRVWSDRLQRDQAEIVIETVYPARLDPSRNQRDNSAQVPPEHAGYPFTAALMEAIKDRLGGGQ